MQHWQWPLSKAWKRQGAWPYYFTVFNPWVKFCDCSNCVAVMSSTCKYTVIGGQGTWLRVSTELKKIIYKKWRIPFPTFSLDDIEVAERSRVWSLLVEMVLRCLMESLHFEKPIAGQFYHCTNILMYTHKPRRNTLLYSQTVSTAYCSRLWIFKAQ